MLTIEALQAFGADTKTGLSRCMNNESFYFRMIRMILTDKNFEKLSAAMAEGDKPAIASAEADIDAYRKLFFAI